MSDGGLLSLFRPVGVHELRLIAESNWARFPPRLAHQPIFYPVLDYDYAVQIARDWNPTDHASGYAGFVTAFEVDAEFGARYPVQVAGASSHRELWVPAEDLAEFNAKIVRPIRVVEAFYGDRFDGARDPSTGWPSDVGLPPDRV